ncbi:MAG: hypothetical protein CMO72_01170 [Verrucomicrobiales bacterium]|nr:hypothetical protein [Verrucomicrobiales bacterium]
MFTKLAHMAKAHYSPAKCALFTCLFILTPPSLGAPIKATVVQVHTPMATRHFQPKEEQVLTMVQSGIRRLSRQTDTTLAWRQFVSTNEVIGLKINTQLGTLSGTRPTVVKAVIRSLIASGVPPGNIVLWDRKLQDLKLAGYEKMALKFGVKLAGAKDSGYSQWDRYTVPALHWDLEEGDYLFNKTKTSNISHTSTLITDRLGAIISIHPPMPDRRTGSRGHLQELAFSGADNTTRFTLSRPHLNPAIGELIDRIAFSRSIAPPIFRKELKVLQKNQPVHANSLHLIKTQGKMLYYYQKASINALPVHTAFSLAYETAKEEMKGQTLLIRGGKHQWEQIVLPDGRNILKRETLGEEEMAQSKLRLHITDALLCQFNHGGQSRPDFATALNELWFSRDPVALDTLSHELITKLRNLMNLPARTNPRKLLRYASGKKLGTDSIQSMKIERVNLLAHALE